jgi:hypothetical protein
MDPNVTGRTERQSQFAGFQEIAPEIEKIVLLDITEATHGNATGAGDADIVSHRFANKNDFSSTYNNIITAKSLKMGAMPLYANSDLDAVRMAVAHSFLRDASQAKIVRIENTLMLEEIEYSVGCMEDIAMRNDMEIISEPYAWSFNDKENFW